MRFELAVALKYLLPRARQLSTSIISLVSILVISLVVWLVVVFLSVTYGIEKTWTEELVALNAPLRVIPKQEYYQSYYYLIDSVSDKSNYTFKTLGEKLLNETDPYDPSFDAELTTSFPLPDKNEDGSLKDLAKLCRDSINSQNLKFQEFEVTFSNLQLELNRASQHNALNQLCYISTYDNANERLKKLILPPSCDDLNNLYRTLCQNGGLNSFFEQVKIVSVKTPENGYLLPRSLYPLEGSAPAFALERDGKIAKVILASENLEMGPSYLKGQLEFKDKIPHFSGHSAENASLYLPSDVTFKVSEIEKSHDFLLSTTFQNLQLQGQAQLRNLDLVEAYVKPDLATSSFWITKETKMPSANVLGKGILISNAFQKHGVHLGDSGSLSYLAASASSVKEQKIPIYVAGFYNPGVMPIGNRIVYADTSLLTDLRGQMAMPDDMAPNGFNIYLQDLNDAISFKEKLEDDFKKRGIDQYFKVESFADYEFAKPVLEQLKSDKTLFTLIAIIILIVACSNIISMLILLVNDKKKEIGILQSMGVSTKQIATIFGLCGFLTGLISSIVGVSAAIFTLHNLQSLINFLSFLQGREAFQSMFYGKELPNELSMNALAFVLGATALISLLAGIVPAVKACRLKPATILRSE